ncbi:MAG: hypothetical protein FWB72_05395 [Firmicutes bacterium]|nr:hypothetical protein [Bacillota bacterium]
MFKDFSFFPLEYRELLKQYQKDLQVFFEDYDAVIFMARKAICFYKALVASGIVGKHESCKVYSSRVLDYNFKNLLHGKKVLLIDDVVNKGASLTHAMQILNKNNIDADIFILAAADNSKEDKENKTEKLLGTNQAFNIDDFKYANKIIRPFKRVYPESILELSTYIANFITLAMCPYNIDQPIYQLTNITVDDFDEKVNSLRAIDITSGIQRTNSIRSYISNFELDFQLTGIEVEVAKVRFFVKIEASKIEASKIRALAIPIIILKEMKYTDLENAYKLIKTEATDRLIQNENDFIKKENMLKVLSFVMCDTLLRKVLQFVGVTFKRLDGNDDFTFGINVLENINNSIKINEPSITLPPVHANSLLLNKYLSFAYDFIYSLFKSTKKYKNSKQKPIEDELFTVSDLAKFIEKKSKSKVNKNLLSAVMDIFIDRGIIIPSVVHLNKKIVRAYKFGEVYRLGKEHFRLFAYALWKYADKKGDRDLYRTELEKLCVLFFRNLMQSVQNNIEEGDEYSINYSKFGPRVSDGKNRYRATVDSVLVNKLFDETHLELTEPKKGRNSKLHIKGGDNLNPETEDWRSKADAFASLFGGLRVHHENDESFLRNATKGRTTSFIYLLTQLSIGSSKKEQLLSLLAEIDLFSGVSESNLSIKAMINDVKRVMDGIESGMLKYLWYIETDHPVIQYTKALKRDKSNYLNEMLATRVEEYFFRFSKDVDKNVNIQPLLESSGEFIYRVIYVITNLAIKYKVKIHRLDKARKDEFNIAKFTNLREEYEMKFKETEEENDILYIKNLIAKAKEIVREYDEKIKMGYSPQGEKVDNNYSMFETNSNSITLDSIDISGSNNRIIISAGNNGIQMIQSYAISNEIKIKVENLVNSIIPKELKSKNLSEEQKRILKSKKTELESAVEKDNSKSLKNVLLSIGKFFGKSLVGVAAREILSLLLYT